MKKALVTGVSWDTGIGFAITKQLVEDGYFVYAIYHSDESTGKEILTSKYAESVECIQCDLTDRTQISSLIARFKNTQLDVIVNNAGAFSGGEDVDNYDISEWDRIFAVTIAMYPFRNDIWRSDAKYMQQYVIDLVLRISKYERVYFVCRESDLSVLNYLSSDKIKLIPIEYDDIWARDIGPTFVEEQGRTVCINWKFNAWGGIKEGSYYNPFRKYLGE